MDSPFKGNIELKFLNVCQSCLKRNKFDVSSKTDYMGGLIWRLRCVQMYIVGSYASQ